MNKCLLTPERGPAAERRRPLDPNLVNPCIYLGYWKDFVGGVTCECVEKGVTYMTMRRSYLQKQEQLKGICITENPACSQAQDSIFLHNLLADQQVKKFLLLKRP